MALGDAYLTVEAFKARTRSASSVNDDAIASALDAASRQVDGFCGRQFNMSEGDEYRFFDLPYDRRWWGSLALGDVVSVTEIASDDGTGAYAADWDVDSYEL